VKSRLSRGREALKGLLDDVEAPPLSQVERRAGVIKTRRRVAQAAAALVGLTLSGLALIPLRSQPPIQPAESKPPVLTYVGSGLVLRSVPEYGTVPDLPGVIVEYKVDGQEVLRTDEGVYARSRDGGQTWTILDSYAPRAGGPWGGPWPAGLEPTWTAPRRTPGGLWWTGGRRDGKPVLAHSSDGVGWIFVNLEGGDSVTATVRGDTVFAFVLQGKAIVRGYQGNEVNMPVVSGGGGLSINGEPVMLPDGRIIVASTESNWMVSQDQGSTWSLTGPTMPKLGGFRQTSDGYVALDLFRFGWIATSIDGVAWQKLPIR